jgi:hypothetical protein
VSTDAADLTPWADAPCVVVYRPACPLCWSVEYILIRTEPNGDGSVTRKAVCSCCNKKFKICVEPLPEFGNE